MLPRLPCGGSIFQAGMQKHGLTLLLAVLLAVSVTPLHPVVTADVTKEYQLKAAFLYNFTKFVEWPAGRFADEKSPIVIGVLGANPFGHELEAVVAGRTVNGRAIAVQSLVKAGDARSVHVVFAGAGGEGELRELMTIARETGVLTVGETPEFAAGGGIINFTIEAKRVRFEINQGSGERAGLRISAQLLKLASIVRRTD